ncbi:hypothetical protein ETB97_003814 [Aspergillus alliaceus]|uniref:Uncharacterized protein n=1 Tax=Petromyces alliaceus TaxID=209559 RepID=A0A8H6A180_PETAA|nr:hypothetical protein ETB97_003814 [Aspergillus burnettii]
MSRNSFRPSSSSPSSRFKWMRKVNGDDSVRNEHNNNEQTREFLVLGRPTQPVCSDNSALDDAGILHPWAKAQGPLIHLDQPDRNNSPEPLSLIPSPDMAISKSENKPTIPLTLAIRPPLPPASITGCGNHSKLQLKERLDRLFAAHLDALKPVELVEADEWLRAAAWWCAKGKDALSVKLEREQETSQASIDLIQGAVDIAKAWWICEHITTEQTLDGLLDNRGSYNALIDQIQCVQDCNYSLKETLNTFLLGEEDFILKSVDLRLWVPCPTYPNEITELLHFYSGLAQDQRSIGPLIFQDTANTFCYGTEFAILTLFTDDGDSPCDSVECVFSFLRSRSSERITTLINSQTNVVHFEVYSSRKWGLSWLDVEWDPPRSSMEVVLKTGYIAQFRFSAKGFQLVWNLSQQIMNTEPDLDASPLETPVLQDTLAACHYTSHNRPTDFPLDPVESCTIRLFERFQVIQDGVCETEKGSPGLLLHVVENNCRISISLACKDITSRNHLHAVLTGIAPAYNETDPQAFVIRCFVVSEPHDRDSGIQGDRYLEVGPSVASVIEERGPERIPYGNTVRSESLRVLIQTEWGSLTDRMNLAPSDLRIGLSVFDNKVLSIFRPPQRDLTVCVSQDLIHHDLPKALKALTSEIQTKSTLRKIEFSSVEDLHKFQEAITGCRVRFDGTASRVVIDRQRRLIPIPCRIEARFTRIQIIQRRNKFQLLAFFYRASHGNCMNFEIKCTDEFESVDNKGEYAVRLRDAKFALPQSKSLGLVCLNELDYPLEHNDIYIMFTDEKERDKLMVNLPGQSGVV